MKKLTTEEFILRARKVHGDVYDYSEVAYVWGGEKIKILCRKHGLFWQTPNGHLNGKGCRACGIIKRSMTQSLTLMEFINKANIIHCNTYNYAKAIYVNNHTKMIIICLKHGEFMQNANDHLSGHGCFQCGIDAGHLKQIKDTRILIEQFIKIFGDRYNYNFINYKGARVPIEIICSEHGSFWKAPSNHLKGENCPKCIGNNNVSKQETKWLDLLNIPQEYRQKTMKIDNKKVKADAYDPINNIIYEFYGDFWHGNPKIFDPNDINPLNKISFGKLYNDTIKKEDLLKNAGYNLVTIWEYDFENATNPVGT